MFYRFSVCLYVGINPFPWDVSFLLIHFSVIQMLSGILQYFLLNIGKYLAKGETLVGD